MNYREFLTGLTPYLNDYGPIVFWGGLLGLTIWLAHYTACNEITDYKEEM